MDLYEQKRPKMLARVQRMDLYEQLNNNRGEATEPSGERRLLPPSPSPEGRDLGRG